MVRLPQRFATASLSSGGVFERVAKPFDVNPHYPTKTARGRELDFGACDAWLPFQSQCHPLAS